MCLGVPGKILDCYESQGLRMARIQFGGIVREACLECVPEAGAGDFVLVHVGFAISRMDEEEAARAYRLLEELGQLKEIETGEDQSTR
jgi:hydrogenase expression/formation protein HypC